MNRSVPPSPGRHSYWHRSHDANRYNPRRPARRCAGRGTGGSPMTPRRALWGLIAVATLLRLAWAASLGPGNDEAYYFLFTAHPDWSYFDQPPMVAVVEAAGLVLSG